MDVHFVGLDVRFDRLGTFVVNYIEGGSIAVRSKGGEDVGEGRNHGSVVLGGHCTHKDCIEVVDVGNKNVLYIFLKERTGNAPVRSVYIVPMCRSARAAKQNISWAMQISSVGMR